MSEIERRCGNCEYWWHDDTCMSPSTGECRKNPEQIIKLEYEWCYSFTISGSIVAKSEEQIVAEIRGFRVTFTSYEDFERWWKKRTE